MQGAVVLPEAGVFAGEPVLGQRLVVTVAERLIDRQRPAPPADGPGEERPVVLVPVGQFVAYGRQQRHCGRRIGRRGEELGILHGLCPVRGAVFPVQIVDGHVGTLDARQHLQGVGLLPGREGQGGQQGQQMDRIPQKNRHRSCRMELSAPTGRNRPAAPRSPPPVRIRNPTDRTEGFRTAKNILPNCKNYPQYLPSEMGPHGRSDPFCALLRTVSARTPDFFVRRASPGCATGAPALPTAPPQQQKGSDHAITPLSCLQCPAPESFSGRGISILLLVEEIYLY